MITFTKRVRYSLRLLNAFVRKHLYLIFLCISLGIAFFFCFPLINRLIPNKKILRLGLVGKYTSKELPAEITELIGNGLTRVTEAGNIEPSLAESWEIKNEGKQYLFTLKENLFWHDGKKIISKDINFNFNDVATSYPDSKKIVFDLKEPFAPFLTTVARPVFKTGLVGSGGYRVKSIKKNGQIIEKIYLLPLDSNGISKLPHYLYKFYPTEDSAITAFKLGEIDIVKDITNNEELKIWKNIKLLSEIKFNRFVAIYFNTSDKNLADKNVRQALAYSIEKSWKPRALTPINQKIWAYNSAVKLYDYDLEKAKNLLEKNAYNLIEIELATIPSLVNIAEKVKQDWAKMGIDTKIKIISRIEDNFQAILITQIIPEDPDQYTMWHSTQTTNLSRYKSPKVDKLLEEGRKTLDQDKRKSIYFDFQRFLIEDSPAIFLFFPTTFSLVRN